MKAAVLALALSLTPVAAEAWAPRPMPSLHKSAPMRAEAAVAVTGATPRAKTTDTLRERETQRARKKRNATPAQVAATRAPAPRVFMMRP